MKNREQCVFIFHTKQFVIVGYNIIFATRKQQQKTKEKETKEEHTPPS
jgi:hypothetical protein